MVKIQIACCSWMLKSLPQIQTGLPPEIGVTKVVEVLTPQRIVNRVKGHCSIVWIDRRFERTCDFVPPPTRRLGRPMTRIVSQPLPPLRPRAFTVSPSLNNVRPLAPDHVSRPAVRYSSLPAWRPRNTKLRTNLASLSPHRSRVQGAPAPTPM